MQDYVITWNNVLLEAIRHIGGSPCPIGRAGAMMHGAIYDAVNSIVKTHQPYLIRVPMVGDASVDAAISYAAHQILINVYPSQQALFDTTLSEALSNINDNDSPENVERGRIVGLASAFMMIANRTNDGSENNTPYVPGNSAGDWRPTIAGASATSPNWPQVRPFTMTIGSQFRPSLPGGYTNKRTLLRSAEYAAQFNEVKELGGFNSTTRTEDETEIAFFWANDLDGTYKPPGHLFRLTQIVSKQRNLSTVENARLFALVGLAMGDAAIVAWDSKYATFIDLWRPETAIQLATKDGNPNTVADPSWLPLSVMRDGVTRFSPQFPAYVSGHATFGAAQAGIMRNYFGTDNVTFTLDTEDPSVPDVKRTFNSFTAAALENARSRVYLGVHFQWDGDNGFISGSRLADYVFANFLKPL